MKTETPDSWITRHEMELEPGPPPEEDFCPVCERYKCVCPSDDPEPIDQTKQSGQIKPNMKSPTIKQLNDVRSVAGNGWGDGDFVEDRPRREQDRVRRSLIAFENWIEHLQGAKFKNPIA